VQPNYDSTYDRVMFLRGRVVIEDGAAVPNDVVVERVCNGRVRQQVYAALNGDFNMQLGSRENSMVDASGDQDQGGVFRDARKDPLSGIPQHDLANCELRSTASGLRSDEIGLAGMTAFGGTIDVGSIGLRRTTKVQGATVNATAYMVPKNARKAYERGKEAEKKDRFDDSRKYFEQAVQIYPKYVDAWFQLGTVLQKVNRAEDAQAAYVHATSINSRFMPAYLALGGIAVKEEKWTEVVELTNHILELDPLNRPGATDSIWELDAFSPADAYFYNAVANYKLNKYEQAEKSALNAERHVDLNSRFPQLHLLLADLFDRRKNTAGAISEMQTYLELVPNAKDAEQVREQLAKLEKLNGSTQHESEQR
jgi:TolA-binding protein